MAKRVFKNGRNCGRRSGNARIVKPSKLKKLASVFRLPVFREGSDA